MRLLALALVIAGCGPREDRAAYLDDVTFRRAALMSSLVNPANGYSRLRLEHYGRDWDALPEWNPSVSRQDLELDEERPLDLRDPSLGEAAFFRYPVQATTRADLPSTVRVRLDRGVTETATTCATCHSRLVEGAPVPGLANEKLVLDPRWGEGRVDVAIPAGEEPVAIPDLRATALETHLHRDGTVRNIEPAALAIRIETLLVTAHAMALRPPREVTWALATYLESLAPPEASPPEGRGADLFAARCARCHAPPSFAGPPVPLELVGTDPRVGESADRGTGGYRVPSLRGVSSRGRLLHDASIDDVATLLDPTRGGGHRFGFDLSPHDREALLAYVIAL